MSWPIVPLGELTKSVDYGLTASAFDRPVGPKFLRITDIQDDVVDWDSVPYCIADSGQIVRSRLADGDIVFARTGATTGKSFLVRNPPYNAVFASYLIRVRPNEQLDPIFLSHFFRSPNYWNQIEKVSRGAAQPGVNASVLKELAIPLPTLPEQRRIAAILEKADAIQRRRQNVSTVASQFMSSVFIDMFGDPVKNPYRFDQKPLSKCAHLISGGTPSKTNTSYWTGQFPWVSPKDMKVDLITDAQDHLSEAVFEQTRLKKIPPGTPLIVVRGMILAHTVPMAIAGCEVAINQDLKAIRFFDVIDPIFGFWCLRVQHQDILGRVDTAAHGTKRLDTDRLGDVKVIIPDKSNQKKFASIFNRHRDLQARHRSAVAASAALLSSLSQLAFRGEI